MNTIAPLYWPSEIPRKKDRKSGQFKAKGERGWLRPLTVAEAVKRLTDELYHWDARNAELSADFGKTRTGNVSLSVDAKGDPGCVLIFDSGKRTYTLPVDTYDSLAQNIGALAGHLNAVRATERYGVASVAQTMGAFVSLPAPKTWRDLLGNPETKADAESAYRKAIMTAHPDRGGSEDEAARLNDAISEARKALP